MKSPVGTKISLLFLILFISGLSIVTAQDKPDIVLMLNGQQKEGKVKAINANSIKFVYTGEDLEYEIKKANIHKIEFGSGRVEIINQAAQPTRTNAPMASAAERKNKIAVLPFDFVTNDPSVMPESLGEEEQTHCVESVRKNTSGLTVQDPVITRALLAKNQIDREQLKALTPGEVAKLLGVEYVIYGTTNLENKGTNTSSSQVTTYKESKDKAKNQTNNSGKAITTNSSYSVTNYNTHIALRIYNDKGQNIYSDSRNSFGTGMDAYKGSINYMIKRTPFGSKHK